MNRLFLNIVSNIGVMLDLVDCVELKVQHPLFQGIAGRARNDVGCKAPKSLRDDTLLTGGFNRRNESAAAYLQSPARTILDTGAKYRPCGTWIPRAISAVRRLKPTVNRVSSLRDFFPLLLIREINFKIIICDRFIFIERHKRHYFF